MSGADDVARPSEPSSASRLAVFTNATSQMSPGERAVLEGILAQLRPSLAIEIGSAEGGCLERIAAHSDEAHSLDLVVPQEAVRSLENVRLHTGDSHALLPELLAEFARAERNVDFVHVDGDHSAEGVKRDLNDLLASAAVRHTVILIHDSMNEEVRAGLEQVPFDSHSKVVHVDLDFVGGYLFREESLRYELWGGFGLVLVDASRLAFGSEPVQRSGIYSTQRLLMDAKASLMERELAGKPSWADALSKAVSEPVRELEGQLAAAQAHGVAADAALEKLQGQYQELSSWAHELERQLLEAPTSRVARLGRGYSRLKQRLLPRRR